MRDNIEVYHGTIYSRGLKILEKQEFYISRKNSEWLGNGIYFWEDESDAAWWADLEANKKGNLGQSSVVLSVSLSFERHSFLNLDDRAQMDIFVKESENLLKALQADKDCSIRFKSSHQQKAFFCNYYKAKHNIVLIAYTFPVYNPHTRESRVFFNPLGFEYTFMRKQYCTTDNRIIEKIILMEADDYAI